MNDMDWSDDDSNRSDQTNVLDDWEDEIIDPQVTEEQHSDDDTNMNSTDNSQNISDADSDDSEWMTVRSGKLHKAMDHQGILLELLDAHKKQSTPEKQVDLTQDDIRFYADLVQRNIPKHVKVFVDGENFVFRCKHTGSSVCSFKRIFEAVSRITSNLNLVKVIVKNTEESAREFIALAPAEANTIFNVCGQDSRCNKWNREIDDLVLLTAAIHNSRNGTKGITIISKDNYSFLNNTPFGAEVKWMRPARSMSGGSEKPVSMASIAALAVLTFGMCIMGSIH